MTQTANNELKLAIPSDVSFDTGRSAIKSNFAPVLDQFANGLRKDWDAVIAGLTMPWSSGAVEGNVNRIKMIKRKLFGRAKGQAEAK